VFPDHSKNNSPFCLSSAAKTVVDIRLLFVNPADAARGCPENPNCCERGFAREAILLIAMLFLATAGLATLLEQV